MKKTITIFALLSLVISISLLHADVKTKWEKFGVTWIVADSKAEPRYAPAAAWNYTELTNYNSIISDSILSDYNSIDVRAQLFERMKTPCDFMISFAVTSEYKAWYYHVYSFRFTGGFWGMNRVALIHSDRLDRSKPFNTKNNRFVNELASAKCSVRYNRMYNFRVAFEGADVVLYINGEKALSYPFPEKSHSGRIAVSTRDVKVSVDRIWVKRDDKIIFEDDFDSDSIHVNVIKATRGKATGEENGDIPE